MYYIIDEPYNVSRYGSISFSNDDICAGAFVDFEQANSYARYLSTCISGYGNFSYKNVYVISIDRHSYKVFRPLGGFYMKAIKLLKPKEVSKDE